MTIATSDLKTARTPRAKRIKPGINAPLTFDTYLSGAEEMARYDIIDGWKVYYKWGIKVLPSPTRDHKEVLQNIFEQVRAFQQASKAGRTIVAPCDVLIRRQPLQTRQPDLLFIGNDRWSKNPSSKTPGALDPAPELVVEILSPSDTRRVRLSKVADYALVGVLECWLVSMEAETIEIMRLSEDGAESVNVFGHGQSLESVVFPCLTVIVDEIFHE